MTVEILKSEQLNTWGDAFETGLERMLALTQGLSRGAFNFKPAPGRWSVGQCIEKANRRSDTRYGRGPFMGRVLLVALRTPGMRYPAPRRFQPGRGALDPDRVCKDFHRQATRMQRAIKRCDGLALDSVTMPWPVLRPVRISLAQAIELQVLHTDRHLKQAERVTRVDGFPG